MIDENIIVELVRRGVVTDTFRRLKADKKERLYNTALRQFGKFGYDGLALDLYCKDASISKGSFFQYFPSKTHLLEFAILLYDNDLGRVIDNFKKNERSALVKNRLLYLFRFLSEHFERNPIEHRFYLFVTNAMDHAGVVLEGIDLRRHLQSYIDSIIERGVETNELRGDFRFELTSFMILQFYSNIIQNIKTTDVTIEEIESYLVTFLFDGIKA